MTELRKRMLQDLRIRNRSPRTQQIYINHVARFARHFKRSPDLLGPEEIRQYQVFLLEEKKASPTVMTQAVCALRFFYQITLRRDWPVTAIPFPKRPRKLPYVLSQAQVSRLIYSPANIKHRLMLMTLYSAGLRISELANLGVEDINRERMIIEVRAGKGQKHRQVPLSPTLLDHLGRYWRQVRPDSPWLFPGQPQSRHIDRSSIGRVVEIARKATGLSNKVSAHTLRHCFATHHLESGVNIKVIQELLGHANIRTTMIYLHVAKKTLLSTESPLDLLPAISPTPRSASPSPEVPEDPEPPKIA